MCPALLENEERCFGGMTFFAQSHPVEVCGSNGLPLTPNSITIYGKSQFLKTIHHPNLSTYLDIIRSKHERVVVVAEYNGDTLNKKENLNIDDIVKIAFQCLLGLQHMNNLGLVHRHLNPENILVNKSGNVQLYNFGLYYMTDSGKNVSFPIGYPKYTAPEVFLSSGVSSSKVDSWSLGMIIAELLLGKSIWPGVKLSQCLRKVLSLIHCETSVFERLARETNCYNIYKDLPDKVKDFVDCCLQIHPLERKVPEELLKLPIFEEFLLQNEKEKEKNLYKNVIVRKMDELYYLWQLAGGDITVELKKQGFIRSRPPILSIPNLVILLGQMFGRRDTAGLLDLRVVKVPLDTLHQRLSHIPYIANYPWLTNQMRVQSQEDLIDAASQLPLIIRERDTEYQFYRIVLYDRLLQVYPITREAIIEEAHKDIPPPVRGAVWAALLGITGDIQKRYDMIDKETPTHTDRQIEVDIPRCHQYSELLSSGAGHERLQRLLKAWVRNNPHYVYWQGLDSLTAPFLYLNFNNEGFNECILLFSDLPEIDIELCVKDSMMMYQNTPPSITYRKHQFNQPKDINWLEPEPGTEKMPRISVDDFLDLLNNNPERLITVDVRNNIQFERGAVVGSINIPFTSVQLSLTHIETLGPHAKPLVENKNSVVVIIGPHDQNNALFADFLVKCGVVGVCSLQGGISILRAKSPNVIVALR
ncbi:TBC domain-containing protein kinase-like protein isoform X3 [Bombus bifarius]|uniref:TBC domain-containing protein kinase-like protein isoform X3 n=1 Tax=Bombus bifarius TaxID=103933 RepID=A0A6P8NKB9_9HYME|nr:TBC domain-containing protein kinase-like protein isoform X3 [Bombus vancouverensis nearcticus]XP_033314892.1 TBC domain-containing protein kinase-like protein isoform X3 [Bombus bifarius]